MKGKTMTYFAELVTEDNRADIEEKIGTPLLRSIVRHPNYFVWTDDKASEVQCFFQEVERFHYFWNGPNEITKEITRK